MTLRRTFFALAICSYLILGTAWHHAWAAPYSFAPIGQAPFNQIHAADVSADGSVVVGYHFGGTAEFWSRAYRWTNATGMVYLEEFPGGSNYSFSIGVSADASVIVGWSQTAEGPEAFRWTSETGIVGLDDIAGGDFDSAGWATSADGSVVVGHAESASGPEAFLWTSDGGMVGLGDLPEGSFRSRAYGVSADGSVVVGIGASASGSYEAFIWSSDTGMVGLGDLPGGLFSSKAYAVSGEGAVVVGRGLSGTGYEAFRWTSEGGMIGLGHLPGPSPESEAFGTSADGAVVVGYSKTGTGILDTEAFVWTNAAGMQNLRDVLIAGGATGLDGWALESARQVSADGTTIVGTAVSPSGRAWGFVATVPEPSTLALAAFGLAALVAWGWQRRKW